MCPCAATNDFTPVFALLHCDLPWFAGDRDFVGVPLRVACPVLRARDDFSRWWSVDGDLPVSHAGAGGNDLRGLAAFTPAFLAKAFRGEL